MAKEPKGFDVDPQGGAGEASASAGTTSGAKPGGARALPEIDFMTFVLSLSTSALYHLGDLSDQAEPSPPDLPLAKQTIDILGILQEKTKGNLTGEEERILDNVLYDLRLKYVDASRRPPAGAPKNP